MSNALVQKQHEAFTTMESFLSDTKAKNAIARVLPRGMTADRLVRFAMAAATKTPDLLQCHPSTVMMALLDAAYYGLEPNPLLGHAYLIPYNNKKTGKKECQFMVGYKGLEILAERTGLIEGKRLAAVYKGDEFEWVEHCEPPFTHRVNLDVDRTVENIKYVYCVVKRRMGMWQGVALNRGQVERYRKHSQAAQTGFAWRDHWDAMALKTVARRAFGKLPLDVGEKLGVAIAQDMALDLGAPVNTQAILDGEVAVPEVIDRGDELARELEQEGLNG